MEWVSRMMMPPRKEADDEMELAGSGGSWIRGDESVAGRESRAQSLPRRRDVACGRESALCEALRLVPRRRGTRGRAGVGRVTEKTRGFLRSGDSERERRVA